MDLDLNCLPPSPEPAAQEDLRRSMLLRQHHAFRDQAQDLHRLYWTHKKNLTPFWKRSDALAHQPNHPSRSHTIDFDSTENPGVFAHCYGQGKHAWENLDVKGSIRTKPDPPSVQGRSGYRCVIDLEKPATLDDDMELVSFTNYATRNGVFSDNSQCVPLEVSPVMRDRCRDHGTPYVSSGSTCSTDTPDSHSSARAQTTVSGRVYIDLNVAQEDGFNNCLDPSKVLCSPLASAATGHSGDFCNNSSKTFHNRSESSIGSSKGSSITVVKTISVPDGSREPMAPGSFCDSQSTKPFCVEIQKYNALLRGNMHHQHAFNKIYELDSQGIPRNVLSVSSSGGNNPSGLSTLGDSRAANLAGQPSISVQREPQEEPVTVISDDEMEGIDLNVAIESIEQPSNVTSSCRGRPANNDTSEENSPNHCFTQYEYPTDTSRHPTAESKGGESPAPGIAIDRSVFIPETPQGHDYACPRLRSSSKGESSIPLETVGIHQAAETGQDETNAATAAETLVSIFTSNSAWMADSHGSNTEIDAAEDGDLHEAPVSLDSFEETILSLEEMKDDGESVSVPVRPPDKDDGASSCCGIRLKRGRGMRDFQREILPGLVSLARYEICDDLHAIGYEVRKTRLRRSCGDLQGTPPTRTRLPRRCSAAWNP